MHRQEKRKLYIALKKYFGENCYLSLRYYNGLFLLHYPFDDNHSKDDTVKIIFEKADK